MAGFLVALVLGLIAFTLTWDAIHKPKPVKPQPVTTEDVWASIRRAQQTLDRSRKLIYPELG